MLFAPDEGPQTPLLHHHVFFHPSAVRRELPGGGASGDDVADELDAASPEGRREKLPLEAGFRIAHCHTSLARNHDDLPPLLHSQKLRNGDAQTLGDLRRDHERRVLLASLYLRDHGSTHPSALREILQGQPTPPPELLYPCPQSLAVDRLYLHTHLLCLRRPSVRKDSTMMDTWGYLIAVAPFLVAGVALLGLGWSPAMSGGAGLVVAL